MTGSPTTVVTQGTTFTVKVGSGSATPVAGFTDFSGIGSGSATVIDASDLSSTFKQKQIGLPDEGQAKLSFNYITADPGQVAMSTARATRALADCTITLSNGEKYEFSGYVLTWEKQGGTDKILTISGTVEITGAVTYTAASGS
jgi:hypothetical protein